MTSGIVFSAPLLDDRYQGCRAYALCVVLAAYAVASNGERWLFCFIAAAEGMFCASVLFAANADAIQRTFLALLVETAAVYATIDDGFVFKHALHLLVLIRGQ